MMKEVFDIIKAYDVAVKDGRQTALATVVKVEGSSYRRPGARMLVTDDGQLTGAISGGCLEGDALRRALSVMQQQKPMLVTYDTTDEEDAKLGVQLGCNGIVYILIEPVTGKDNAIELLRKITAKRQDAVIATLFSLEDKKWQTAGTYILLTEDDIEGSLPVTLLADMQNALSNKASSVFNYESMSALIDYLSPAVSLVIFGAGNDAIPLTQMAYILGWQIIVVDGRTNYATRARFPVAGNVMIAKPGEAFQQLFFDENTVAVLMTHNFNYDLCMLKYLLPLRLPYVGVLGPKAKLHRMLSELEEEGLIITKDQLLSVYGPTGLDIGAETAEEIALSVLSEIKMVLSRRNATSLRKKETTIHADE